MADHFLNINNGKGLPNGANDPTCEDGRCEETDRAQELLDQQALLRSQAVNYGWDVYDKMGNVEGEEPTGNAEEIFTESGMLPIGKRLPNTPKDQQHTCAYYAGQSYCQLDDSINPRKFLSNYRFRKGVKEGELPFTHTQEITDPNFDYSTLSKGDIVSIKKSKTDGGGDHMMMFSHVNNDGQPIFLQSDGETESWDWRNKNYYSGKKGSSTGIYQYTPHADEIAKLEEKARTNPTYIDAELTEKEMEEYRAGGWVIEEYEHGGPHPTFKEMLGEGSISTWDDNLKQEFVQPISETSKRRIGRIGYEDWENDTFTELQRGDELYKAGKKSLKPSHKYQFKKGKAEKKFPTLYEGNKGYTPSQEFLDRVAFQKAQVAAGNTDKMGDTDELRNIVRRELGITGMHDTKQQRRTESKLSASPTMLAWQALNDEGIVGVSKPTKKCGGKVPHYEYGGEHNEIHEQGGYEYKKEGEAYLTRKKGSTNWVTASGDALDHIKYKIYNEGENPETPEQRDAAIINRMRSVIPDVHNHGWGDEGFWSNIEYNEGEDMADIMSYGNALSQEGVNHDPNSAEGKAFEAYARKIASPEAWMKLYPNTMGKIFDPNNDPTNFSALKQSWGDANPLDVELGQLDATGFGKVDIEKAKEAGSAYAQGEQYWEDFNAVRDQQRIEREDKIRAEEEAERQRVMKEEGFDIKTGTEVPQWKQRGFDNPTQYYDYLQEGGLEYDILKYAKPVMDISGVSGAIGLGMQIDEEGLGSVVSDVANTGADLVNTGWQGLYEGGDYLFGDGSFDMSDKNTWTGRDKWEGLQTTGNLLSVLPYAGAVSKVTKAPKLIKTGANLFNKGYNKTKNLVTGTVKKGTDWVGDRRIMNVGMDNLTVGDVANTFNKNVMKTRYIPKTGINQVDKFGTGWGLLTAAGIDNTVRGDNTYGDIVSGNYDPTKSAIGRTSIVTGDKLGLLSDDISPETQAVVDEGYNIEDTIKIGINLSPMSQMNKVANVERVSSQVPAYVTKATQKATDKSGIVDHKVPVAKTSALGTSINRKEGGVVYKTLSQKEIDDYREQGWIIEDI
tara:strand:- start:2297 stop:5494 length:3198 start_codon:yes stop_codon:yes gene_type:complete